MMDSYYTKSIEEFRDVLGVWFGFVVALVVVVTVLPVLYMVKFIIQFLGWEGK